VIENKKLSDSFKKLIFLTLKTFNMATLITSGPAPEKNPGASTYEEYSNSRKEVPFDEKAAEAFEKGKNLFKESVIGHLSKSSSKVKVGEYFLFKVSELKKLTESSPEADHIRFHNTVDENHYHKLVAVPVQSTSKSENKEVINKTSLLLDSYPCPPDPRCPK
jgi:hypothetical protein